MPFFSLALGALAGVVLDRLLGEPRGWHPLVGFGRLAGALEARFNPGGSGNRIQGLLAWALAVLPWVALAWALGALFPALAWILDIALLAFALGGRSLDEHLLAVARPLAQGELAAARSAVGRIVSRDTARLKDEGIAKATVESALENGHDAVFGTLFWFALLGGPGALLFRLANTLDAMWGYRSPRFLHFGWAAARMDDGLGYISARLTALTYALLGATQDALGCWRGQAPLWQSPNAGPVMAAGAGALGVSLGGAASYRGRQTSRPLLGQGPAPRASDIHRAIGLVRQGLVLWLAALLALALILAGFRA